MAFIPIDRNDEVSELKGGDHEKKTVTILGISGGFNQQHYCCLRKTSASASTSTGTSASASTRAGSSSSTGTRAGSSSGSSPCPTR